MSPIMIFIIWLVTVAVLALAMIRLWQRFILHRELYERYIALRCKWFDHGRKDLAQEIEETLDVADQDRLDPTETLRHVRRIIAPHVAPDQVQELLDSVSSQ